MNYEELMKRAISLANQYKYTAKPNPVVGCILIKDNKIISEGAHEKFGCNHAEINAINSAKLSLGKSFKSFKELTLICTLEPCNHSGKTGPCTEVIINSGIKNVVIGSLDPNPLVSGKGIESLKKNGINVTSGLCAELIEEQNKFFFFKNIHKRPFITAKIASSVDGKSHFIDNQQTWITSKKSREDVQKLRASMDIILTGGNTVTNDNPLMNARVNFPTNQPKKILLSNKTNFNFNAPFFKDADYEIINENNLNKVISGFKNTDITSILVEAGPKLVNSFLNESLVDKLIIYKSSMKLGPNGVSWFKEDNAVEKLGFNLESSYKIESDTKKIYIKC
jgi:diaminohydroxyphosphoribosylaminopyrimidine deaminase/5-amino-6-(5-phosphoribosylamino)uracil reductase